MGDKPVALPHEHLIRMIDPAGVVDRVVVAVEVSQALLAQRAVGMVKVDPVVRRGLPSLQAGTRIVPQAPAVLCVSTGDVTLTVLLFDIEQSWLRW